MDWSKPLVTPYWKVNNQYCSVCPRDIVITLGNIILEATMSRRDRYFEIFACRDIINDLFNKDKNMKWKTSPKPTMKDEMYNEQFFELNDQQKLEKQLEFSYSLKK